MNTDFSSSVTNLSTAKLASIKNEQAKLGSYTSLDDLRSIQAESDKELALSKASKQFESMFVNMLFKSMRQANAVFEDGNIGKSNADSVYRDMYDQQLSVRISEGRGIGIADMVYKQLKGPYSTKIRSLEMESNNIEDNSGESPTQIFNGRYFDGASPYNQVQAVSKEESKESSKKSAMINSSSVNDNQHLSSRHLGSTATITPDSFVNALKPIVSEVAQKIGLDPVMMIAQAALETGWGKHVIKDSLGKSSNNLFNIKADQRWQGPRVATQTLEYRDGIAMKESAKFRRYDSIYQSVVDYLDFVTQNPRYSQALSHVTDAKKYIEELQSAGYATDPQYAEKIKAIYSQIYSQYQVDVAPMSDSIDG